MIYSTLTFLLLIASSQAFLCPDASLMEPCTCQYIQLGGQVGCQGPLIDQETLNRVFLNLRQFNGIAPHQAIDLYSLHIFNTNLTQFDLTPIIPVKVRFMYLGDNFKLAKIAGPPVESNAGLIDAEALQMPNNALADSGLGQTLHYFSPRMGQLTLTKNQLKGSLNQEFLPGFEHLINLIYIEFEDNKIEQLGGRQFQNLSRLEYLNLKNNQIKFIGENSFSFNEPPETILNLEIRIELNSNLLTSNSFHIESLSAFKRPVVLSLENNEVDTLQWELFEPYLESHDKVTLYINSLVCDPRVKWLKDRRDEFENNVWAPCVNDEGETVFSSSLIG